MYYCLRLDISPKIIPLLLPRDLPIWQRHTQINLINLLIRVQNRSILVGLPQTPGDFRVDLGFSPTL